MEENSKDFEDLKNIEELEDSFLQQVVISSKQNIVSMLNVIFNDREFYDLFKKENLDVDIVSVKKNGVNFKVNSSLLDILSNPSKNIIEIYPNHEYILYFKKKLIENNGNVFENNIKRLMKILLDRYYLFDIYKLALNNMGIFRKISSLGEEISYNRYALEYKSNEVYIYDFIRNSINYDNDLFDNKISNSHNLYKFRKITDKEEIFIFLKLFYKALKTEIEEFETVSDFFDI